MPHVSATRRILRNIAAGPFAEPVMGFTMLMVGFALLLPHHTFSWQAYRFLELVAPEEVWGVLMFGLGGIQMAAGLLEHRTARLISCMVCGVIWVFWTCATYYSGPKGVLWAFGVSMVVGQGLAYLRAAVKGR